MRRALLLAALVVAACSGGDDGDGDRASPPTSSATTGEAAGTTSTAGGGRSSTSAPATTSSTAPATTTTAADRDVVAAVDLGVGDCFDDGAVRGEEASAIREVRVLDCAGRHRNEVYAMTLFESEGADYPGDGALAGFAQERCVADFPDYVGRPVEETDWGIGTIYPDEASWRTGDREVLCVLFHRDGRPVEGSARAGD